jgi:hypothetical protein
MDSIWPFETAEYRELVDEVLRLRELVRQDELAMQAAIRVVGDLGEQIAALKAKNKRKAGAPRKGKSDRTHRRRHAEAEAEKAAATRKAQSLPVKRVRSKFSFDIPGDSGGQN